jgi:hypothetical protein
MRIRHEGCDQLAEGFFPVDFRCSGLCSTQSFPMHPSQHEAMGPFRCLPAMHRWFSSRNSCFDQLRKKLLGPQAEYGGPAMEQLIAGPGSLLVKRVGPR